MLRPRPRRPIAKAKLDRLRSVLDVVREHQLVRLMDLYERKRGIRDPVLDKLVRKRKISKQEWELIQKRLYTTHDFGRHLAHYSTIYRLFRDYSQRKTLRGKRLLHLASSVGFFTEFLQNTGVIAVGLDINRGSLKMSKEIGNSRMVQGDGLRLPFANQSFDCMLSDHFLFSRFAPIKKNELQILDEAARVIRPNGIVIISLFEMPEKYVRDMASRFGFIVEQVYDEFEDSAAPIMVLRKLPPPSPRPYVLGKF